MKTSYFAKYKDFTEDQRLRAVSIARGEPGYYDGKSYKQLAPSWEMIHGSAEFYDREYTKILANLDPEKVIEDIGEKAILLCWEKPPGICHRRWIAEWLEENLDMKIPELDYTKEYTYRERQTSLFDTKG